MRGAVPSDDDRGMETAAHPRRRIDRALLMSVLTGCSIVLTLLTGLVVGWFAIDLQLFGDTPDAEDHEAGAGGYGAATVVLLLGAVALRRYATASWQLPCTLLCAVVVGLLTVRAVADAMAAEDPGPGINHWWDGAGGVLACPWTWWLVALGIRALLPRRGVSG